MIYEHFNMRLHEEIRNARPSPSWDIRTGEGLLEDFSVGSFVNPKPVVKKNALDILGTSGETDLTEESGRVFFENKTVTVILQGRADMTAEEMEEVESLFSSYQGRVVDFKTDDYQIYSEFQVGRMTAEFNRHKNRITITLDTEPYLYGDSIISKPLPVLSNYEVVNNDSAWSITGGYGGEAVVQDDHVTRFAFCFDTVGAEIYREKTVGAASGFFALGILSIVGGDIWFENADGETSRTLAEVIPLESPTTGAEGKLRMVIRCDGSYYEWVTVNNERQYLPTVRCQYILSNYLPVDSSGYLASSVQDTFRSNVAIRPYVLVGSSDVYVITDGVASVVGKRREYEKKPNVLLPNIRADFESDSTTSVMVAVAVNSGTSPTATLLYRKAEVF